MLFRTRHGAPARAETDSSAERFQPDGPASGDADSGAFGYLFPDAPETPYAPDEAAKLDALGEAMALAPGDPDRNTRIPPVMTYFGQFIDHDITAGTDSDLTPIDGPTLAPAPRRRVASELRNLRGGALNLDSLYGGTPGPHPIEAKIHAALRFHGDRAKLWAGTLTAVPQGATPLPTNPDDIARDLLRLRDLLRRGVLTEDEIRAAPDAIRDVFLLPDGRLRVQRAVIGDMRNDENLAIAQLHLAFVRLHNVFVQHAYLEGGAPVHDPDALFDWAARMTRWHYQWLVAHAFLPAICDRHVLDHVRRVGPVLYRAFHARNAPARPDLAPLPLEFSTAAFRFGHSMVREVYDWNQFFGLAPSEGDGQGANFRLLQAFTGNGDNPMFGAPSLPSNWPIDWARFVHPPSAAKPERSARAIDSRLAFPLDDLADTPPGLFRRLATRNLRRGLRLNLPSAQACVAAVAAQTGLRIDPLGREELRAGPTGAAVAAGGFDLRTPLWFYVLKEAELRAHGETLGPLGSLLVADTLLGLIETDPDSYVNAAPGGKDWTPADGVKPDGVVIDDMAAMMSAVRLL